MKVAAFVQFAKQAQNTLRDMDSPAEHIYLVAPTDTRSGPSLVFISKAYNNLDIYSRASLELVIQKGPLKINYRVLGTNHINSFTSSVTREQLYRSIKIYGKKPLMFNDVEYASSYDLKFKSVKPSELVVQ